MSLVGKVNSKQALQGVLAIRQGIDGKDGEFVFGDSLYAPAIYSTASGEIIATTDSAKAKPKNIRLFGKSTQDGTPSTEAPQPINHLGDSGSIVGKVLTGNLYNPSWRGTYVGREIYCNGCTTTEKDGVFTIIASRSDISVWEIANPYAETHNGQLFKIPDGVKEISILLSNTELNKNYISMYGEDLANIKTYTITSNKKTVSVVDGAKYFSLRFGKGDAVVGKTYETTVMVNYGQPLDYEPYTEQPFTVLTPNGLKGIGDVRDYVDFAKGKKIAKRNQITFSGGNNETWHKWGKGCYAIYILDAKSPLKNTDKVNALCTHAQVDSYNNVFNGAVGFGIGLYENKPLCVFKSDLSTKEEWIAFLQESPITVEYELQEPIITDLTQEELDQYNALLMNYPNTTVVNDAGAYMEVEYVADTKTYVNDLVGSVETILIELHSYAQTKIGGEA